MSSFYHFIFYFIILICVSIVLTQCIEADESRSHTTPVSRSRRNILRRIKDKFLSNMKKHNRVKIQLYYESLCPESRKFYVQQLAPTVRKLSDYLDIQTYPYGNAETTFDMDGSYEIKCQHGRAECYGNKLHACSIHHLRNITAAVCFNACLMEFKNSNRGSDDKAANKCGTRLQMDPKPIEQCAKGPRGIMLQKRYGEESKRVGFDVVPYILLNGVRIKGEHLMRDVCAALKNPPVECNE